MESLIGDNVAEQEYNIELPTNDGFNVIVRPMMDKPELSSSIEACPGLAQVQSGGGMVSLVRDSEAHGFPSVDGVRPRQGCLGDLAVEAGFQPGFSPMQSNASPADRVEKNPFLNFVLREDDVSPPMELDGECAPTLDTSVAVSTLCRGLPGESFSADLPSIEQKKFIKQSIDDNLLAVNNNNSDGKCFISSNFASPLNNSDLLLISKDNIIDARDVSFEFNSNFYKGDGLKDLHANLTQNSIEGDKSLFSQLLQNKDKIVLTANNESTHILLPSSSKKVNSQSEKGKDFDKRVTLPNHETVLGGGVNFIKEDGVNDNRVLNDNNIVVDGKVYSDVGKEFITNNNNNNIENDISRRRGHVQGMDTTLSNINNNNNINIDINKNDDNKNNKNHNELSNGKSSNNNNNNKADDNMSVQNPYEGISNLGGAGLNKETFAQMAKRNAPNIGGTGFITKTGTAADCAVLVDRIQNSNLDLYGKAVLQQLGEDTITFLGRYPKDDNKILIFLSSSELAKRLVQTGIQLKGQWVVVSHFSTPATKVFISNVMPFVEDSLIIEQFEPFGYVVNNHLRRVRASTSAYSLRKVFSFRRELFIILKPDSQLPDKIEILSEGEIHVLEISTKGQKCFRCGEWGHVAALCPQSRVKGDGPIPPTITPIVDSGNLSQNIPMGFQTILDREPQHQSVNRMRPVHPMHQQLKTSAENRKEKDLKSDRQINDFGQQDSDHSPVRHPSSEHGVDRDSTDCQKEAVMNWTLVKPRKTQKSFSEGCKVRSNLGSERASESVCNIHELISGTGYPDIGVQSSVMGDLSSCSVLLPRDSIQGIPSDGRDERPRADSSKSSSSEARLHSREKIGPLIPGSDKSGGVNELQPAMVSRNEVVEETIRNIKVAMAGPRGREKEFISGHAEIDKKGPAKNHAGSSQSVEPSSVDSSRKMKNGKVDVRSCSFEGPEDENSPKPSAFDSQTACRVTIEILEQTRGKTIAARFPVYKRFLLKYPHLTAMINFTRLNDKVTYKTNTHAGKKIKDIVDELKTILNSDDPVDNSLERKCKEAGSGRMSDSSKKKELDHVVGMEVDHAKTTKRKVKELKSATCVQDSQLDFLKKKKV